MLCGESAGGGLVYSLALRLRELGEELPAGIVAISPWVDLTLSGESYDHNRESDPSLTKKRLAFFADCYVGEQSTEGENQNKGKIRKNEKKD